MDRRLTRLLFICALVAQAPSSYALPYGGMYVFGDSLSDTGNLFTFCKSNAACPTFPVGFPFAPPIAPYDNGRFSNGPVWVEYLAQGLGLPAPAPSNLGGTNYAWGGAETGDGISAQGTPNVGLQIGQFLLSGNVPSPDQLLVLWAGANDFNNATVLPNPAVLVSNIAADIAMLAAAAPGQDLHLLVPNLPPLGETPRLVNTPLRGLIDALSVQFNSLLSAALQELELNLGITIFELDVFGLTQEMMADPAAFGLTNITQTARLPNGVNVTQPGMGLVSDPSSYLFFDDVHPTTAFHRILAERALAAVPEPGSLTLVALGLAALVGIRRSRRAA